MIASLAIACTLLALGWLATIAWGVAKVRTAEASAAAALKAFDAAVEETHTLRGERDGARSLVSAQSVEIARLRSALAQHETPADRADRMGAGDGIR